MLTRLRLAATTDLPPNKTRLSMYKSRSLSSEVRKAMLAPMVAPVIAPAVTIAAVAGGMTSQRDAALITALGATESTAVP